MRQFEGDIKSCIIVPAFNESKRFNAQAFSQYLNHQRDKCFLLVDDGSSDNTFEIFQDLAKTQEGKFYTIQLASNSGKAEAIRTGMLHALENVNSEYIGFIDADLEIPISQITALEEALVMSGNKVAFSRREGNALEQPKLVRRILSSSFKRLSKFLFKLNVEDSQCGCKLFHKDVVKDLFSEKFISPWLFDLELLMRLKKTAEIKEILEEVPLRSLNDVGASTVRINGFVFLKDLLRIYAKYTH